MHPRSVRHLTAPPDYNGTLGNKVSTVSNTRSFFNKKPNEYRCGPRVECDADTQRVQLMIKNWSSRWLELPHKQTFALAGPMILANISVPLMGLADTAMLGHLDDAAFVGAVAVGANIFAFMFWMMAFLRMGTTSVVGQALGANNPTTAFDQLAQSAALAFGLAALLIITHPFTLPLAISWVAADPQVAELAAQYASIRIYAAPAVLGTYVLSGWLLGLQKPVYTLIITVAINTINIVLDYVFILKFNWGSQGAAAASVCADYLGFVIALFCFYYSAKQIQLFKRAPNWRWLSALRQGNWRKLMGINRDLFIRTAILLFVFNFFTAQGGDLGQTTLAANAILIQLMFLSTYALDGYAHAAETLAANAIGAKNLHKLHNTSIAACSTAGFIAVFMAVVFWFGQPFFIWLMTDIHEVKQAVAQFYIWLCVMPIVAVWCYLFDGIFIGAGKTRALRNWMLAAVLLVFLPSWWLLQPLANHGLWIAFVVFHIARSISLGYEYYRCTVRNSWFATSSKVDAC